jgi:regulator of replication initiation timing
MKLEELKQEKQRLESRLYQIIEEQQTLSIEYETLEKQLYRVLGKIEVTENYRTPNVSIAQPTINQAIPKTQTSVVQEGPAPTGASFFEGP